MTDLTERLCRHAVEFPPGGLPPAALAATKRFVLDSIGVGIAGGSGPYVDALVATHCAGGAEAAVWGRSVRLAASGAALVNAYQIHNAEYDCVHEEAVVHPLAVMLGALWAVADRERHAGRPVAGLTLVEALALGVDIAAGLGVASRAPMRFFRPATAGAFGAVAAIGRLRGFDVRTLRHAFGIVYSQLCGTMQAHIEGSPVLAMQVGFNARNAVLACDLAAAGVPGPGAPLEGPFGYFNLFEGDSDPRAAFAELGERFRIEEVAHKPFPSGRATHGIVDALMTLRARYHWPAEAISAVVARVPPLTQRLVGRPVGDDMAVNYARLCGSYVAARCLLHGTVTPEDFTPEALRDPASLALARRIRIESDGNPDANALTPIEVTVTAGEDAPVSEQVHNVYGNPAKPMPREAYLEKFRANWTRAHAPLAEDGAGRLIELVEALEAVPDLGVIADLLEPSS